MRAFISYSHDSPEHIEWVTQLAGALKATGLEIRLDKWHLAYGQDINRFMENEILESDLIFVICTPTYVNKSNTRRGGVGYESIILSNKLLQDQDSRKFVPILRSATLNTQALPIFLGNRLYVDMSVGDGYQTDFNRLIMQVSTQVRLSKGTTERQQNEPDRQIIQVEGPFCVPKIDDSIDLVKEMFGIDNPNLINFDMNDIRTLFGNEQFCYATATTKESTPNYARLANHAVIQAQPVQANPDAKYHSIAVSISGSKNKMRLADIRTAMTCIRKLAANDAQVIFSASYRHSGAQILVAYA
ncbi:MAG: TIR domain-containing protein [Burkholderiales bacterium]|nr:TIR domain-containing protein [Burkholderiales bacterium]